MSRAGYILSPNHKETKRNNPTMHLEKARQMWPTAPVTNTVLLKTTAQSRGREAQHGGGRKGRARGEWGGARDAWYGEPFLSMCRAESGAFLDPDLDRPWAILFCRQTS